MLKIRLKPTHNSRSQQIVVTQAQSPRDGRFTEKLGHVTVTNDQRRQYYLYIDMKRLSYWLLVGGQCSEGFLKILKRSGLIRNLLNQTNRR